MVDGEFRTRQWMVLAGEVYGDEDTGFEWVLGAVLELAVGLVVEVIRY